MGEESRKCRLFPPRMCLSLYDYQSKANRDRKGLTYLKNRVTINQKHKIESQIKNIKYSHKNGKEENTSIIQKKTIKPQKEKQKGTKKKYKTNGKTKFKMAINTYL